MDEKDRMDQPQDGEVIDVETEEVEVVGPVDEEAAADEPVTTDEADEEMQSEAPQAGTREAASASEEQFIPLFSDGSGPEFRKRWMDIQARFVDDPKASVRDADELVEQVVKQVTDTFASQRSQLESSWNAEGSDGQATTEDLRLAVKRYHAFFDRLLSLEA